MKNLPVNMRAVVLILLAFLTYNIADAFLNHAVDIYFFAEAALYTSITYILAILIFHKKFGGIRSVLQTKNKLKHILRGIAGTGCYMSVLLSFKYLTLAEAYTLLLTSPFWVAIFSIFLFREHIGWHRWLSIIIGFIGVLVVMIPGIELSENKWAYSLPLIGALGFAGFVIMTKKIGKQEPLINMLLYLVLVDTLVFLPLVFWNIQTTETYHFPDIDHLLLFCVAGVLYLVGTSLSSVGYASGDSSLLAPLHYTQIIWGALIGYFFFAEIPETWTLLGAAIIVSSGIYLVYREHLAHKRNK